MDAVLLFQDVRKEYRSGLSDLITPLNGIDLELGQGERIVLLGKSGSGKTTLLNLAGGVDRPNSGKTIFKGKDLAQLKASELAEYRRREVGFIFQSFNLFPTLTVGENITLPLELLGSGNDSSGRMMLEQVGLSGKWDRFPEELSGGEQQRVAIARALVKSPSVILADEPTGNLDHETGAKILELMDRICSASGASMLMATHSLESLWLANRSYSLVSGKLLEGPSNHRIGDNVRV